MALQLQEEELQALAMAEMGGMEVEEEKITWLTSHISPEIVIWSSDPEEMPVHEGKFLVGWFLDQDEAEESRGEKNTIGAASHDEVNSGTMFSVRKAQRESVGQRLSWASELDLAAGVLGKLYSMPSLKAARPRLLIIAGAGIGCDSKLPDYRSSNGLWRDYAPFRNAGISLQQMSRSSLFRDDPTLGWGLYTDRQNLYGMAEPHVGFAILRQLCQQADRGVRNKGWFVFTSNVDSHFQKAGFEEDRICESHGSLRYLQCINRCRDEVWIDEEYEQCLEKSKGSGVGDETALENAFHKRRPVDDQFRVSDESIPFCRFGCGNIARPNVSFFSDTSETYVNSRTAMQKTRLKSWIEEVRHAGAPLVILEIGCGTSIHSLRIESEVLLYHYPGIQERASLIRINPSSPGVELAARHVGIGMSAMACLEELAARLPPAAPQQ